MDKLIPRSSHSFLLRRRDSAIACARHTREFRAGDGGEVLTVSRRAHPAACSKASGRTERFVRAGDPREGLPVYAAGVSGEPSCESAALRAEARAHAAVRARTPLAPMGGAPSRSHAPYRRGRPGWVLRFTKVDKEASGSAARLYQGDEVSRASAKHRSHRVHVQRRRRRCRAWQRVRPAFPLTPLSVLSQHPRRFAALCGMMPPMPPPETADGSHSIS